MITKLIPAADESEHLGPAMLECTPAERIFVRALFDDAGAPRGSIMRAAKAAGYSASSHAALSSAGNKLLHRTRVVAAIGEMQKLLIRSEAPAALKTVREIMRSPEHKDRLKAARTILERTDPIEQKFSGHMQIDVHQRGEKKQADETWLKFYAWIRNAGASREVLERLFGFSGVDRCETDLIALEKSQLATPHAAVEAEFVELPRAEGDGDE